MYSFSTCISSKTLYMSFFSSVVSVCFVLSICWLPFFRIVLSLEDFDTNILLNFLFFLLDDSSSFYIYNTRVSILPN